MGNRWVGQWDDIAWKWLKGDDDIWVDIWVSSAIGAAADKSPIY